ncbi:hypothetical protein HMPREF0476_1154 [Kingella kingae ATCC 23330]|uniref:Uncharacterized protein n=1 Tax=Kingella kingae ATCC 23330 TaxID=887327 RepID=F5S7H1_KINKI|nr:hypothetical protein HMPREF0476_1154 [Kingella kingae ATCC 23330]
MAIYRDLSGYQPDLQFSGSEQVQIAHTTVNKNKCVYIFSGSLHTFSGCLK